MKASTLVLALATLALAGEATGAHASRVAGCAPRPGASLAKTAQHLYLLEAGPFEDMFTPAEVQAKHPKEGEVMLSGAMAVMESGRSVRHLEVHICSRTTGKVVTNARPTILLIDRTAKKRQIVPVATMYGITEGRSDTHYGNNVIMPVGHSFTIQVTLGAEKVVFRLRRAK
jgi:hypothetical protein